MGAAGVGVAVAWFALTGAVNYDILLTMTTMTHTTTLTPAQLAQLLVRGGALIADPVDAMLKEQARSDSANAATSRVAKLIATVIARMGPSLFVQMTNALDHIALDEAAQDEVDDVLSGLPAPEAGAARGMQTLLREWKALSARREHRAIVAAAFDTALLAGLAVPGGEIGQ